MCVWTLGPRRQLYRRIIVSVEISTFTKVRMTFFFRLLSFGTIFQFLFHI